MSKVFCLKKVEINGVENFTKNKLYEIFGIDVDYFDKTSLHLEIINNQNIPHIIACITGDVNNVQNEDWYQSDFFKEHFIFID